MHKRKSFFVIVFLVAHVSWSLHAVAQEVDQDEPPEFQPGLIAEYRTPERMIRRLDQDVLFAWDAQSPDARLESTARFSATWTGYLQAKDNGQFRLSLFVCGKVSVAVAGKQILAAETLQPTWLECEPLELRFGQHELQIVFEKTTQPARIGLYWSGPGFGVEPISPRYLFHASEQTPAKSFQIGQALSRGLHCAACHEFDLPTEVLPAPALTHLQDNLRPGWLMARLTSQPEGSLTLGRMPHFGLPRSDAAAITAALFEASAKSDRLEPIEALLKAEEQKRTRKKKQDVEVRTQADLHQGERAFVSIGCLACHQVGELGKAKTLAQMVFGGGDLSNLAVKRTQDFIHRWLADPARVNSQHRMPVFELSLLERLDLSAYLGSLGTRDSGNDSRASGDASRGGGLIRSLRCGACHQLPQTLANTVAKTRLTAESNWKGGCLTQPDWRNAMPGFGLNDEQCDSLRLFFTSSKHQSNRGLQAEQLLAENNCTSCHNRDLAAGLKADLAAVAAAVPDTAVRLAALAPPSLTGIGDKLHEQALRAAISRKDPPLRPWLDVRMPKFKLAEQQLTMLVDGLIAHDRIPPRDQVRLELPSDKATELAAGRLVTAEGFGCQTCHQIGDGEPPQVALNAQGTDLTMLGNRIRSTWFSRWVRNPTRIVPQMEMPAIQLAVKGVLNDSLDLQLEALWQTLNTPGFRPPRPAPVRVVRTHNLPEHRERAHLLTDVIETPNKNFLRPLIFGLPNRQNFLFDLEAARLAACWIGDTARQHTRGKTWYWEPGANLLLEDADFLEQISLQDAAGRQWRPRAVGQFATRFDQARHVENGIEWQGRIHLALEQAADSGTLSSSKALVESRWIKIKQVVFAADKGPQAASNCITELSGLRVGDRVQLTTAAIASNAPVQVAGEWQLDGQLAELRVRIRSDCEFACPSEHRLEFSKTDDPLQSVSWTSTYGSLLVTDHFPVVELPTQIIRPKAIDIVPGYAGIQLPLPPNEMPISFAWDQQGHFYAGSLKGRVVELKDNDGDGLAETYEVISDEFPTPFGLSAHDDGIDALAKFALIRLTKPRDGGTIRDATVVADGWGYTSDYHDWAIGLASDDDGNYYMALPCQQDDRSEAAAYLRGSALKLVPYDSREEPRKYRIEPIAAGLRFPIGIALNDSRDLFTSDNQGNYNPFNELNHLRYGKRYGFINKLENKDGFSPPFESPAINLPHPWTRSVNGICFLRTSPEVRSAAARFGPFEGHLIGCEMNGRSLVRMSLQKVGDTYQGATYMFSRPATEVADGLEGPITCAVSPLGDLYVGSLQDSGWSGGQNTGSVVRFRPTGNLPLGIAEVRGTSTGFEIDFTGPVDLRKAAQAGNYKIRSYQRLSTPAYGGDDQDERNERVKSVRVAADHRRVELLLGEMRAGFVYELNIAAIGASDDVLFPSQAHYTLRAIP